MASNANLKSPQIDNADRPALMQFVKAARKDSENPVCLFKHTAEFFTIYGVDAEMIASDYFLNKTFVRCMDVNDDKFDADTKESFPYINILPSQIEKLLKLIVEMKRRCVILYSHSGQEFIQQKQLFPGQLESISDFLFEPTDECSDQSCLNMSIFTKKIQQTEIVGVALYDPLIREFSICEFTDNCEYSSLESLLIEHAPKQCILAENKEGNDSPIFKLLEKRRISCMFLPKAAFSTISLEQDLKRILITKIQHILSDLQKTVAMASLASLLRHGSLMENDSLNGRCSLTTLALHGFMKPLDNNASRALNLFPSMLDSNSNSSLFGVLNKCKMASGTRLLQQWIKQPLISLSLINARLDCVESFSADSHLNSTLRDNFLKQIPDLARISQRLQQQKANLADCVRLYQFSLNLPNGLSILSDISTLENATPLLRDKFFKPLQQSTADFQQFNTLIESTIDLDAVDRHEFIVRADFSEELSALKNEKDHIVMKINKLGGEVEQQLGLLGKLKIDMKEGIGYHFRLSRKEEKVLRGSSKFIYLDTRKDGVRFTTHQLKELSSAYSQVAQQYNGIQSEISAKCISVVASYSPLIDQCGRLLSQIDVLASFAHVVNHSNGYVRPTLLPIGSRIVKLKGSRHPCLELQPHVDSYINNDVDMDPEHRFQVITGPNMGGKSTYLRQIALTIIMAQIGSFVPCDEATISVCDCILARVGAGDSQLRGISTFYAEMLEASSMIRSASKNSFIIIDELGRGTSTSEGFGLAWAISDYICRRIQCMSLFATHFQELTEITGSCPEVVNRHVTAHTTENEITMLYQVQDGACDRSFGIHVAEMAKFPTAVIAMAQEKGAELERAQHIDRTKDVQFLNSFHDLPLNSITDEELFSTCMAISQGS